MNLKLALVDIQLKADSFEVGQNSLDMFSMFMKSFAKDKDVIHI